MWPGTICKLPKYNTIFKWLIGKTCGVALIHPFYPQVKGKKRKKKKLSL
jgi:hypothetical protein